MAKHLLSNCLFLYGVISHPRLMSLIVDKSKCCVLYLKKVKIAHLASQILIYGPSHYAISWIKFHESK